MQVIVALIEVWQTARGLTESQKQWNFLKWVLQSSGNWGKVGHSIDKQKPLKVYCNWSKI